MLPVFIYEGGNTNHFELNSMSNKFNYRKYAINLGISEQDRATLRLKIALDVLREVLDALEEEVPSYEIERIYQEAKQRHPNIIH
jgi:hypothetical protein